MTCLLVPALALLTQIPTFPSASELVYVRFHVDRKGTPVTEIRADQLRVLEDGEPQEIAVLETPGTRDRTVLPEITLVLDISSSVMDERLLDEEIVREALLGSLHAGSKVGLCAFGGRLECFAEPTADPGELMEAFGEAVRFGRATRGDGTRLYASLADLARDADAEEPGARRALIVFTDALDTTGARAKTALEAATAADVRVYAVMLSQAFQDAAIGRGPLGGGPRNRATYDYKKLELETLADETNGRSWEPGTLNEKEVARILRAIGTEISSEIVVGYVPRGPATGRKRKVKVQLVDKSLGKLRDGERTLVR